MSTRNILTLTPNDAQAYVQEAYEGEQKPLSPAEISQVKALMQREMAQINNLLSDVVEEVLHERGRNGHG